MAAFKPENTYTVEQFISAGKLTSVSYDKFSYRDRVSNGTQVAVLNIIDDYFDEIKDQEVNVRLSKEEYRKYRFKPKLLCYDIYGNGELYWIILRLNGMIDVKEFDTTTLKMLPVEAMSTLLTQIYNAEYKWMDLYNRDHDTM